MFKRKVSYYKPRALNTYVKILPLPKWARSKNFSGSLLARCTILGTYSKLNDRRKREADFGCNLLNSRSICNRKTMY